MDNIKTALLLLFTAVNLAGFVLFGIDKALSKGRRRRIRERTLIISAFFSGMGGFLAMCLFRHKIRKPKFYLTVPLFFLISALELGAIIKM